MKKYTALLLLTIFLLMSGCALPGDGGPEANMPETSLDADETEYDAPDGFETDGYENTVDIEGTVKGVMKLEPADDSEKAKEKIPLVLYYQDRNGFVIPATRRIEKVEGIAKAALSCLVDSALNRETLQYFGLYPVLPEGTRVLGMTIKEGIATVDFNEKLLEYEDQKTERNIITSIVYTLTEFNTISKVRILINGYQVDVLKFETDVSEPLGREDVLINASRVNIGQDGMKLDVYLFRKANDMFSYIAPVSVEVDRLPEEEIPGKIIELLNGDFSEKGFYSELPSDTRLMDSHLSDGMLVLDFSPEYIQYGGSARERAILDQVLLSMKQIKGTEKIKIMIDGSETVLPEGTDTSIEMKFPALINDIIDSEI